MSFWSFLNFYKRKAPPVVKPAMVFHYHGYRAGLTGEGRVPARVGDAVGLADLILGRVTHVGVPQHHTDYVWNFPDKGMKIVRTIEAAWNCGLSASYPAGAGVDLELRLRDDAFFDSFADSIEEPCHGIAWDVEFPVHSTDAYPVTAADLAFEARMASDDKKRVECRTNQIATIARRYILAAQRRFGNIPLILYSGYAFRQYNRMSLAEAYGVDWRQMKMMLPSEAKWYRACASWDEDLPPIAADDNAAPYLHNIASGGANETKPQDSFIYKQTKHRLSILRPGEGLSTVHAAFSPFWTAADQTRCHAMGRAIAELS